MLNANSVVEELAVNMLSIHKQYKNFIKNLPVRSVNLRSLENL